MTKEKTQWKEFLEAISVLQWVLSFLLLGLSCIILVVYLMFTSLWPLCTLYFIWLVTDWQTPERGGRRSVSMRKWRVWEHLRDYFPVKMCDSDLTWWDLSRAHVKEKWLGPEIVDGSYTVYIRREDIFVTSILISKLVKTAELNPNKNYILGCHPHGIMSAGAFTCFSTESCGFADLFPGVRCTLAILAGMFRVPLFRDYIMSAGLCPVSKPSLVHLLSKSGKGNAVVIVIGGAAESLASSPGVNTVLMKQRKGFVRLALEFGADLVPVYSFGENDLYQQVLFSDGSLGRRLQDLFKKIVGFAPCLFVGERMAVMPYKTPITTVVGSPISVPKRLQPTEEEIDHYHRLYMEALTKLFHEHKVSCGLSESHKLRII